MVDVVDYDGFFGQIVLIVEPTLAGLLVPSLSPFVCACGPLRTFGFVATWRPSTRVLASDLLDAYLF